MHQMLVRVLAAALCTGGLAACSVPREPALPAAAPEALRLSPAVLERADSSLEAFVDSGALGGVYAVIARQGRIGYERTFGWRDVAERDPLRRDDVFRIYSMTKPVIAVGVLRLVEQGRVDLDDPVSRYIPGFANVKVFVGGTAAEPVLEDPESPITVRQLLNHTSGLAYGLTRSPVDTLFAAAELYHAGRTLEEFANAVARIPLLFHPGTAWSYSSGLDVAGRVIEVASGRPLDRFLEEELFRPLGMRDTGFRIRPDMRDRLVTVYRPGPEGGLEELGPDRLMAMFEPGARFFWGSGGLLSTPDDFLRFAQMLLNGGTLGETRILRPETVRLMTGDTVPRDLGRVSGGGANDSTYRFGLGVAVRVDTVGAERPGPAGLFRWSGYLGTYFWIDPANNLIAMVWAQLSPGARYPLESTFQELVYEALEGEAARSRPRDGATVDSRVEWPGKPGHVAEVAEVATVAEARPLFTSGDAWLAAGFAAGTLAMAPFDLALAQALQDSTLQVHGDLRNAAAAVRWLAFPGTAIIGASMYLGGRVADVPELADIGLHGSEAVVVSYAFVLAGKTLLGRARPRVDPDQPFDFELGRGFHGGSDYRSFPSGHTAGAFAVAAAVTAETRERWPEWTPYVAGALYTGAVGVGVTRMYHNLHWASDVVAGAAIGTFSGLKVVRYHHDDPDNLLDRWLLPKAVVPTGDGPMLVWEIPVAWRMDS